MAVTTLASAPGAGADSQTLGEVWAIDADAGMAGRFVFFDGSWDACGLLRHMSERWNQPPHARGCL
jgi:hypothetical protein